MPKLPRTVNFPVPAKPTRYEILEGLRITAPVAAGYIPLGLAYGVLVIQLGLPWWLAPALSLSAYSGSAELLVVTLAAQNTPLAVIAVTMLLVNFRLFALTALFITLTLDAARTSRALPSVLLAGASFAVAMVVAPTQRLLVALLLFVACLVGRHILHRRGILHSPESAASADEQGQATPEGGAQ